jgi:hypothetical protein
MPSTDTKLVIDNPENFHLLTTDAKEQIIKGAIATVNVQAEIKKKNAIENLREDFILRNNFTASQVQYTQMPQGRYSLSAIESRVRSTEKADYMARQETGGIRKPAKGSRLAIPTNIARGGSKSAPVAKQNYLTKLKVVKGGSKFIAQAAIAASKRMAVRYNDKLFLINNFQNKSEGGVTFKMQMIYGLDKKETITPASPWLKPASEKPAKDVETIFIAQMKKLGM